MKDNAEQLYDVPVDVGEVAPTEANGNKDGDKLRLIVKRPRPTEAGFLLRQRRYAEYLSAWESGVFNLEAYNALVEFVLDQIEEPQDREEARRIVEQELSREQFNALIVQIVWGGETDYTLPLSNSGKSRKP